MLNKTDATTVVVRTSLNLARGWTVVFESGMGEDADSWNKVRPAIAEICASHRDKRSNRQAQQVGFRFKPGVVCLIQSRGCS